MAYAGTEKTKEALSRLREMTRSSFCEGSGGHVCDRERAAEARSRTKLDGLKRFYGMTGEDNELGTRHISGNMRSQM